MAQSFPAQPILLVDDETDVLQSYKITLRFNGISNFVLCSDSTKVMDLLAATEFSAIVLDLNMPHLSGRELMGLIHEQYPEIHVIVVTASNSVATAVECMKLGALDYLVKPVEDNRFVTSVRNAVELIDLRNENTMLRQTILSQQVKNPDAFSEIITVSESMRAIFSYTEAISGSVKPVLVTGESGTGKELFARAIHAVSGRKGKFVAVNVGGLDDTVFSDTLFGHRKGAFTGADSDRRGLVEEASGGTFFLDEIGSLEKSSQTKLLRLGQENEFYPLGSDVSKNAHTVVVAATNEDLQKRMKEGLFRNDLYFRLITHHIQIPPLRQRREDIPVLFDYFLEKASASLKKTKPRYSSDIINLLNRYDFPGNVRELEAMIFDATSRCQAVDLDVAFFRETIAKQTGQQAGDLKVEASGQILVPFHGDFPKLHEVEEFLIKEAMKKASDNQYTAAELLGVAQSTLWRRFKKK
jgi:DNA-binding NtrC family response regulator